MRIIIRIHIRINKLEINPNKPVYSLVILNISEFIIIYTVVNNVYIGIQCIHWYTMYTLVYNGIQCIHWYTMYTLVNNIYSALYTMV